MPLFEEKIIEQDYNADDENEEIFHTHSSYGSLFAEGGEPEETVSKKPSQEIVNNSDNDNILASDNGSEKNKSEPEEDESLMPKTVTFNAN